MKKPAFLCVVYLLGLLMIGGARLEAADLTELLKSQRFWSMHEKEVEDLFDEDKRDRVDENTLILANGAATLGNLAVTSAKIRLYAGLPFRISFTLKPDAHTGACFRKTSQEIQGMFDLPAPIRGKIVHQESVHMWRVRCGMFYLTMPLKMKRNGMGSPSFTLTVEPMVNRQKEKIEAHDRWYLYSANELKQRVQKQEDGSWRISKLPVTEQMREGYCFHASYCVALASYGFATVSQENLSAYCNLKASEELTPLAMEEGLQYYGKRYANHELEVILGYETGVGEVQKTYNKLAKNAGKSIMRDGERAYDHIEPEILETARLMNKTEKRQWHKAICKYIRKGYPVFWVCLDSAGEETHSRYHCRIIYGYHPSEQKIYYIDTCNKMTPDSSMTVDKAYGCSIGTYVLIPE